MNKNSKGLFLDVETTGLNPIENGIVQISGIIDIGEEEAERFDFRCRPFEDDVITDEALNVIGFTEEEVKSFPDPKLAYYQLKTILNKYVDPYDKEGIKFISIGYNFAFDLRMMNAFFTKCVYEENPEIVNGLYNAFDTRFSDNLIDQPVEWLKSFWMKHGDNYFASYNRNHLDVRQMYIMYALKHNIDLHKSTQLAHVCEKFDIPIKAHDSMSDIEATRKLYYILKEDLGL